MFQQTALNQGLRQPADGCPRKASSLRKLTISQQVCAWPKRAEYLHAAL